MSETPDPRLERLDTSGYPCGDKWLCYWADLAGQTPAEYLREYLAEVEADRRANGPSESLSGKDASAT